MHRSVRLFLVTAFAVFAMISLSPNSVYADGEGDTPASGEVSYRQNLMRGVGSNMGSIGDTMKYRLNLPGHVANHAGQLAASADLIAAAFKNGSPGPVNDSKAEIWSDWAGFEKAIADFKTAAEGLQAAAEGGDPAAVGPAMKALGKSCGGCHEGYRKPKEESYKNR